MLSHVEALLLLEGVACQQIAISRLSGAPVLRSLYMAG